MYVHVDRYVPSSWLVFLFCTQPAGALLTRSALALSCRLHYTASHAYKVCVYEESQSFVLPGYATRMKPFLGPS